MKNVKDRVYAALCTVSENVSDAYPRSWAEGSTIQYTEEQNDVYEASCRCKEVYYKAFHRSWKIHLGNYMAHVKQSGCCQDRCSNQPCFL